MTKQELCSCEGVQVFPTTKSKRVRCPVCKRRMIAKTLACSCCYPPSIKYVIPPHKPKMWYKKK